MDNEEPMVRVKHGSDDAQLFVDSRNNRCETGGEELKQSQIRRLPNCSLSRKDLHRVLKEV